MLTVNALCADLEASGRYLTPRAARDWWTKGLLPRPERRSLGRARGTETFWIDRRVSERARAAYDLLAVYPRADIALLSLWLLGYPVGLSSVRAIYFKLINRHLRSVHKRAGKQPDDIVGGLAEMIARQWARTNLAPTDARRAYTDLALELFEIFYGIDNDLASEGLAEQWAKVVPHLQGISATIADLRLSDGDLAIWAQYLKELASFPAQHKMMRSASDFELMRARRLVIFIFGYLHRIALAAGCPNDFEEFGRQLLVVLGRPAVPILVAVLRRERLRHNVMSSLLEFVRTLPDPAELAARMRGSRLT